MNRICNKETELERPNARVSAHHEDHIGQEKVLPRRESSAQTMHTPYKIVKLKSSEFHIGQEKSMANFWGLGLAVSWDRVCAIQVNPKP